MDIAVRVAAGFALHCKLANGAGTPEKTHAHAPVRLRNGGEAPSSYAHSLRKNGTHEAVIQKYVVQKLLDVISYVVHIKKFFAE